MSRVPPPAQAVDVLLSKVRHEFSDFNWETYVHISEGWDHDVLLLDNAFVFRFPNSPEYLAVLSDEIRLLENLKSRTSAAMPNYQLVASDHSFAGYPIISGIPVSEETFKTLIPTHKTLLAQQLAEFFTAVHKMSLDELSAYGVSEQKPVEYSISTLAHEHVRQCVSDADFEKIEKVIDDIRDIETRPLTKTLVHGDISPKHILWDAAVQQLGIIDFSDRNIDDPAFDFAELYLYDDEFVEEVYLHYKGPKDPNFLSRAKTYLKRVGIYLLADSQRTDRISFETAKRIFDLAISR